MHITTREQAVLNGLADGLTDKEIAARMNISVRTVKYFCSCLRMKAGLDSNSARALIAWAFRSKLVT